MLVIRNAIYLHSNFGRLTQLVQSASLTRRKSGVRVPHCPPIFYQLESNFSKDPVKQVFIGFFVFPNTQKILISPIKKVT